MEFRRAPREDQRIGRRITDGRAWYEGELTTAAEKAGWFRTADGRDICPNCQKLSH